MAETIHELEASIRRRGEALLQLHDPEPDLGLRDIGEHYIGIADELRDALASEVSKSGVWFTPSQRVRIVACPQSDKESTEHVGKEGTYVGIWKMGGRTVNYPFEVDVDGVGVRCFRREEVQAVEANPPHDSVTSEPVAWILTKTGADTSAQGQTTTSRETAEEWARQLQGAGVDDVEIHPLYLAGSEPDSGRDFREIVKRIASVVAKDLDRGSSLLGERVGTLQTVHMIASLALHGDLLRWPRPERDSSQPPGVQEIERITAGLRYPTTCAQPMCSVCKQPIDFKAGEQAHGRGQTGGPRGAPTQEWWHYPACPSPRGISPEPKP